MQCCKWKRAHVVTSTETLLSGACHLTSGVNGLELINLRRNGKIPHFKKNHFAPKMTFAERVCRLGIACSVVGLLAPFQSSAQLPRTPAEQVGSRQCYTDRGQPQRCFPPFQNIAPRANVTATNTCGSGVEQFCRITSAVSGSQDFQTERCVAPGLGADRRLVHPVQAIIDQEQPGQVTWWQSDTMQDLDWTQRHSINITLSLGKAYDLTYVQVRFHSLRPHSWILHKSVDFGRTWTTYQYFSWRCREVYGMVDVASFIRRGMSRYQIGDQESVCTSEFSDRIPISGGRVVFGTLEDKRNKESFVENDALREWVTATDIRLEFTHMNTFGDEIFGDWQILQCYYYSVESVSIGARCQCNGHASECLGIGSERACVCQHNTTGPDCGQCAPFYVDKPWAPATDASPFVCQREYWTLTWWNIFSALLLYIAFFAFTLEKKSGSP